MDRLLIVIATKDNEISMDGWYGWLPCPFSWAAVWLVLAGTVCIYVRIYVVYTCLRQAAFFGMHVRLVT